MIQKQANKVHKSFLCIPEEGLGGVTNGHRLLAFESKLPFEFGYNKP